MNAAFALFAALAAAPVGKQEVRATAACDPVEVEIGQPIECTLEVRHPRGLRVRIDPGELALDDSWLVLEEGRVLTADDGEAASTRARWLVASLEPGARSLSLPLARYEGDGAARTLAADPLQVTVRAALGEGEDAPRPALGFRPPPAESGPPFTTARLIGAVALCFAAGGAFLFVRARRRRQPPLPPTPSPLELLARLKDRERGDVRALHHELAALVRSAVDAAAGEDRRGLTDDEWLARTAIALGVSKEAHEELAHLLADCERVKYGEAAPTHWAAGETIDRARALVERLQNAEAPVGATR